METDNETQETEYQQSAPESEAGTDQAGDAGTEAPTEEGNSEDIQNDAAGEEGISAADMQDETENDADADPTEDAETETQTEEKNSAAVQDDASGDADSQAEGAGNIQTSSEEGGTADEDAESISAQLLSCMESIDGSLSEMLEADSAYRQAQAEYMEEMRGLQVVAAGNTVIMCVALFVIVGVLCAKSFVERFK